MLFRGAYRCCGNELQDVYKHGVASAFHPMENPDGHNPQGRSLLGNGAVFWNLPRDLLRILPVDFTVLVNSGCDTVVFSFAI